MEDYESTYTLQVTLRGAKITDGEHSSSTDITEYFDVNGVFLEKR